MASLSAIDRIIDHTAQVEGGRPTAARPHRPYDAWNANDAGYGVSFGMIQFNQKTGSLPAVFQRMRERAPARFDALFGPWAARLVDPAWVKSNDLNEPDLKARIIQSGAEREFQQAQRDVARSLYFGQAEKLAREVGIKSQRGYAMLFDAFVQRSPTRVRQAARAAKAQGGAERQVLTSFAQQVDEGGWTRRQKLLDDPALSDDPVPRLTLYVAGAAVLGSFLLYLLWD